jgi:DNA mismatch repair protein MutS2
VSRPVDELLEFNALKEIVSRFTTCAPGRRAARSLAPRQDAEDLHAEFALVDEAMAHLRAGAELGFGSLADPEAWLPQLGVLDSVLSSTDLLAAASLTESVSLVRQAFKDEPAQYPLWAGCAAALSDFRHLSSAIRRAILPNGEIRDDASPHLQRIRSRLVQARENIQLSLGTILRARGEPTGEDYITVRKDRFVIPVRASDRRAVPGVVHAASATGQTVFVEPLETIDLNNRLAQLAQEEAAEIARVLADLTERLRAERVPLQTAAAALARFDSIFARARFARSFDCVIPQFSEAHSLNLAAARNPVLEATLRPQGRATIPLSLALGGAETVMVVSGPNTGGKTVALKTVGLAALSAQSGIPVAADHAQLPVFDMVLADIGDEQSIAADLSTFSAHVLNIKSMLHRATDRSLVLIDELGTGTAPDEGAALAVALLEEFRSRKALTLATTHHDRLKAYASTTAGIVNAAMEFDQSNLRPTYRLLEGVPGTSSGIEIARRLGLPKQVIEHAEATLSPDSREARDLISYLHRSLDQLEAARRQARDEIAQLEAERRALQIEWVDRQKKRIAELERSFRELQKRFEGEVARLASDIKDRTTRTQMERQTGRRMGQILSETRADADAAVVETLAASQQDLGVSSEAPAEPLKPDQLVAGVRVSVKGFKQPVIFRRQDGRTAEVEAGMLRMKVPLADILRIVEGPGVKAAAASPSGSRGFTVRARPSNEPAGQEINVIGCTVEEATRRVDKFLDQAALAGQSKVRIIHGYGTGALRRGLGDFLSDHPLVETIHAEAQERGGNAVTVAELKS